MLEESPLGLLSFLSFGFSIIAAVLAIDMYTLLRTGQFGNSWRVMIIASVIFVLVQVLRLVEILHWQTFQIDALAHIVELVFVMALAYAFFLQRKAFNHAHRQRVVVEEAEDEMEDAIVSDWDEMVADYHDTGVILPGSDEIDDKPATVSTPPSRTQTPLSAPNPRP